MSNRIFFFFITLHLKISEKVVGKMIALRCGERKCLPDTSSFCTKAVRTQLLSRFEVLMKNGDRKQWWDLGQKVKSYVLNLTFEKAVIVKINTGFKG